MDAIGKLAAFQAAQEASVNSFDKRELTHTLLEL